jgi:hypothetical protein
MKKLIAVGYWVDPPTKSNFPDPLLFVDPNWEREFHAQIVHYLKSGIRYAQGFGYSYCRFPDGPSPHEMGSADFTDGVYVWPEGLWVYVDKYNVRLPESFILHMKQNGFKNGFSVNRKVELPKGFPPVYDYSFWLSWASSDQKEQGCPGALIPEDGIGTVI